MKLTEAELVASCHQFELEVEGVSFWTPYWLNADYVPFHLDAPLRGKGDPVHLVKELRKVLDGTSVVPTPASYRRVMFTHGLGIDCSGFVYHVLETVLAAHDIRLADGLIVPKAYVTGALQRFPDRMRPELLPPLPETLPLGQICDLWDKSPVDLVNVRWTTQASIPVKTMGEVRPGDLIAWLGGERAAGASSSKTVWGQDHVGVVTHVGDGKLTYWSSDHDPSGPGGVGHHELVITDPDGDASAQAAWPEVAGRGPAMWRLKILD